MSDLTQTIRGLLTVLRQAGGDKSADSIEAELASRGWRVDQRDLAAALSAVQGAALLQASRPSETEREVEAPPARARVPTRFSALADLEPWVRTLPGTWTFLDLVETVATAALRDVVVDTLSKLFCDSLGYEQAKVNETSRLWAQTTIDYAATIAQHNDFHVVVAWSRYIGHQVTSLEPLFRLHPQAIVFAFEPFGRIRVVARKPHGREGHQLRYRLLRGRGRGADADDDILVWARRLMLLEPHRDDDAASLAVRAYDALDVAPQALARNWLSADVREEIGSRWSTLARYERESFLQLLVTQRRVHWGLEAELQSAFPWSRKAGESARVELRFLGYEVVGVDLARDSCTATRRHTSATLRLHFEYCRTPDTGDQDPPRPMSVLAALCVPDDEGVFVLYGEPLAFVPSTLEGASEGGAPILEEDIVDLENATLDEAGDTESHQDDADDAGLREGYTERATRSASLLATLRSAVRRRLGLIGVRFAEAAPSLIASAEAVQAFFGMYSDVEGRLGLTALSFLRERLEPLTAETLGAVEIGADSQPPAWACLDSTSALPVGRARPVACARLGPGGVIAVPFVDASGVARLSASLGSATEVNPRSRGATNAALWIAPHLERWALTVPGAIARAAGRLMRPGQDLPSVLRTHGEQLVLLVDRRTLVSRVETRSWWQDVPSHPRVRRSPELLVSVGQLILPGQPLARCALPTWTDACEGSQHSFSSLFERVSGVPEANWHILRCPPSIQGRLISCRVEPTTDNRGYRTAWRIWIQSATREYPAVAVLPDGREARVELTGREDLPARNADGAAAPALLQDPACLDAVLSSEWYDARTGDALVLAEPLPWVRLVRGDDAYEADIALGYRVVDGWARPRAASDPQLTFGELRRLRALAPDSARVIDEAAARPYGFAPVATSLASIALAVGADAPPVVPADWPEVDESTVAASYDPARTALARPDDDAAEIDARWQWRCTCGALRGALHAFETCVQCGERVQARGASEPAKHRSLPFGAPVLHPWRKSIVAALLGLTSKELGQLAAAYDASTLVDSVERAMASPDRNLLQRLQRERDDTRRKEVLRSFDSLEPVLSRRVKADDLWLRGIRYLPDRMLFDGYPFGAPDLLASPITERYRDVQASAGQLEAAVRSRLVPLRRTAWVNLQRAVDQLFGSKSDSPEPGTLGELLRRVWATTAPAQVRVAVPGLYQLLSLDEVSHRRCAAVFCRSGIASTKSSMTERPHRGVLAVRGPLAIEHVAEPTPTPAIAQYWRDRAAYHWLAGEGLAALAGVCSLAGHVPSVCAALADIMPADAEREDYGFIVLRELLLNTLPARGHATQIRALVAGERILTLPSSYADAVAKLQLVLRSAMPETSAESVSGKIVIRGLSVLLSGFWMGAPCLECPRGWVWSEGGQGVPQGFRRAVPRLGDRAWTLWSSQRAFTDPIGAAAANDWGQLSRVQLGWLGLPAVPLPAIPTPATPEAAPLQKVPSPSVVAAEESLVPDSIAEEAPRPTQARALDVEIVVLECDLASWLQARGTWKTT